MKKIILIYAVLIVATACEKTEKDTDALGTVVLNIGKTDQIVIDTKASTSVPAEDTYNVAIKGAESNNTIKYGTYTEFKEPIVLVTGNYRVEAENITPEAAVEGRGAARYYGAKDFRVNAGLNTDVALQCAMTNARVSFEYSETFKLVFINYSISIHEDSFVDRKIAFDADATIADESTWAYFNIDETPSVTLVVAATRKDDNVVKIYTRTLAIAPKTWSRVTINSTVTHSTAGVGINVDTDHIDDDQEVNIDPY